VLSLAFNDIRGRNKHSLGRIAATGFEYKMEFLTIERRICDLSAYLFYN
jgi:hypothetical protein